MNFPVHQPNDADQWLDDFGVDVIIAAVPAITRGLMDDNIGIKDDREVQRIVLRLKRGALGTTQPKDLAVVVDPTGLNITYKIDYQLPRDSSLFDYYQLRTVK